MKKLFYFTFIALFFFLSKTNAQITIIQDDVTTAVTNKTQFSYDLNFNSLNLNLGTSSSSAQTWDFTQIQSNIITIDSSSSPMLEASGQPGFDSFSDATLAAPIMISSSGTSFTLVHYYYVDATGVYMLGYYQRTQVPPVLDTSRVVKYSPSLMAIPLPLTHGTKRTSTSTSLDDGETELNVRTITADGFGTVIFPSGASADAIRMVRDEVTTFYENGVMTDRERSVHVDFYTSNMESIGFEVDTNYTGGNYTTTNATYAVFRNITGINSISSQTPGKYILAQNYPNPFNPSTNIRFSITEPSFVSLKIYNILGKEVADLVSETKPAGNYEVNFNAKNLSSGVYFYQLTTGSFSETKKMILSK